MGELLRANERGDAATSRLVKVPVPVNLHACFFRTGGNSSIVFAELRELLAAFGVDCQATTKSQFDGSILTIEGTARRSTGQIHLQALGIISYDDAGKSYCLRASTTDVSLKPSSVVG